MKLPRYNMETFDGRAWYAPVEREKGWWVMACDVESLIDKLKCCGNCRHFDDEYHRVCRTCDETVSEKWEMRE